MKFYNSIGPNPRVVKMFMHEKGIELPYVEVDLMQGENRKEPFLAKNPAGQLPVLELDDGSCLAEITAICEYLDEKFPGGSLIGTTPEERAETRMWTRRVDLNVCEPIANGFRYSEGLQLFQNRMRCLPDAAAGLKAIAQDKLAWIDKLLEGKEFLAGKRMTLADILLFGFVEFGAAVGQPINPEHKNVVAWFERIKARPSAAATA
ncbi:MAG TPA: glutathione S-transferase [Rhodobiaceae bacterium]|jgi:glutathione S-transferase|nr:glutathione S-transferase [Rhodobiaceae bacterium]